MVVLMANDGTEIEFPDSIYEKSATLADLRDNGFSVDSAIPLVQINQIALSLLKKWSDVFLTDAKRREKENVSGRPKAPEEDNRNRELTEDELNYLNSMNKNEVMELLNAANFLAIQEILDFGVIFVSKQASLCNSAENIYEYFVGR